MVYCIVHWIRVSFHRRDLLDRMAAAGSFVRSLATPDNLIPCYYSDIILPVMLIKIICCYFSGTSPHSLSPLVAIVIIIICPYLQLNTL